MNIVLIIITDQYAIQRGWRASVADARPVSLLENAEHPIGHRFYRVHRSAIGLADRLDTVVIYHVRRHSQKLNRNTSQKSITHAHKLSGPWFVYFVLCNLFLWSRGRNMVFGVWYLIGVGNQDRVICIQFYLLKKCTCIKCILGFQ